MEELFTKLAENGVLAAIVAVFLAAGYRLLNRLFDSHTLFLTGLTKREDLQQQLCQRHADILGEITVASKDSVSEMSQLKQAALRHCEMCRAVVVEIQQQMPGMGARIEPHLREMERLLS